MSKRLKLIYLWIALFLILTIMYDTGKNTSDFSSRDRLVSQQKICLDKTVFILYTVAKELGEKQIWLTMIF